MISAKNITLQTQEDMINHGDIGSQLGAVTFTAEGRVDNRGRIIGEGSVTLRAKGDIDNHGTIRSTLDDIIIATLARLTNHGTLLAQSDLTLEAGDRLTNTQTIGAYEGDITLTTKGALTNSGSVLAQQRMTLLAAGDIINSGTLRTQLTALAVTAGRAFFNTGSVVAEGALALLAKQGVIHNDALLGSQTGAVTLSAAGDITNSAAGVLQSQQALAVTSDGAITNAGNIVSNASSVTMKAQGALDNLSSMHAATHLTATGQQGINNTGTLTAAFGDLTLGSEQSIRHSGLFFSGRDTVMTAAENIYNDNTIIATRHLTLTGTSIDSRGTLAAGLGATGSWQPDGDITLTALANYIGSGTVVAANRLNVTAEAITLADALLEGAFINITTGEMSLRETDLVGIDTLAVNATGSVTHEQSTLTASTVSVTANSFTHDKMSSIDADTLDMVIASDLTNRGLINGHDVEIHASTLSNVGTGRIYGTHLALQTDTLNNLIEGDSAATIASRDALSIGVDRLTNTTHSLIYSDGDMAIGRTLAGYGQVTGMASVLNNHSATIEAGKGLTLRIKQLNNINDDFETARQEVFRENIIEYRPTNSDLRYSEEEITKRMGEVLHIRPRATGHETDNFHKYTFERITEEDVVVRSDPGKIIAGNGLTITAEHVLNDKSQIIAGGTLSITANQVDNIEVEANRYIHDIGIAQHYYRIRQSGNDRQGITTVNYLPAERRETVMLTPSELLEHTVTSGAEMEMCSNDKLPMPNKHRSAG